MNKSEIYLSDAIDVIEEVLESGGEFRLFPKGTSMLPLIRQGRDSVTLKRNFESGAKKHDIAFYRRRDGAFVLHRVMKLDKNGDYIMCGDNQTRLEKGIKREMIIGYVSAIGRDENEFSVDNFPYRAYVALWCFMPLRKICLFIKRVFNGIKRRIFPGKKV